MRPATGDKKSRTHSQEREIAPEELDLQKKECAAIFEEKYRAVMASKNYIQQRDDFKRRYG